MWAGLESRKFPRVKAQCKISIHGGEGNQQLKSVTENIGAGGICVLLGRSLDKMSRVKLELDLSDGKGSIQCGGRVAWAVRKRSFKPDEQGHDIGIEFVDISPESVSRIEELVNQSGTQKNR